MTERVYRPRHEPPKVSDRVLSHPGTAIFSLWSIGAGLSLLLSALVDEISVSASVSRFPDLLTLFLALCMGIGGIFATLGLLFPRKKIDSSWIMERMGWTLAGAGWAGYAIAFLSVYHGSILAWGTSFAVALMAVVRIFALVCIEKEARIEKEIVRKIRLTEDEEQEDPLDSNSQSAVDEIFEADRD